MNRKPIHKIDYFVGVFVSAILNSATSVPALFEETKDSKRVEFATNLGDFNTYVKYSTVLSEVEGDGKREKSLGIFNLRRTSMQN